MWELLESIGVDSNGCHWISVYIAESTHWLLLHLYTFLINPQTAFKTLNLKMDDYLLLSAKQMKNMLYYKYVYIYRMIIII